MKDTNKKVAIKDYGFIEWYLWKIDNSLLFRTIHTVVISAITSLITVNLIN